MSEDTVLEKKFLRITSIRNSSNAFQMKLKENDIIFSLDGELVNNTYDDFSKELSQMGINTFGKMLYLAALISLPVVGGLLLIQGAIGVITRSAPSLNLFSFGFPIALISLFIFLYAGVDPISNAFSDITGMSINLIDNLLHSPTKKSF